MPEGYEVEISAINKLCTIDPANLVPETDDWKIVPDITISNSTVTTATGTNESYELGWEIVTSTPQSPFTYNIIAREAMGQMAMAIGSTAMWNHHHLFPEKEDW